ncbi:MAG: NADH-quinone oxidoreductase subunit D [Firmicutes bacterium]|nr:NADH-quinone oxidoreductase subunit D [Bacillota bacterium]
MIAGSPSAGERELERELLVNMGPQHPSTHGVLRVIVRLNGENVVECRPDIGYLHRCFEKICEEWNYLQIGALSDRNDYIASLANEFAYYTALERLVGIEVPERADFIRVIMAELQRISSHLVWYGTFALDLGATTPFLWAFREREVLLDLFEAATGARLTYNFFRPGGVRNDLPAGFDREVKKFLEVMEQRIGEYDKILTGNRIFVARTKGVATLTAAEAVAYGASGPTLRGSGVDWDLRRDAPYSVYDRFQFEVCTAPEGDCLARYHVRMNEIRQSIRIVRQALEGLPEGDFRGKTPKAIRPKGEVYMRTESPRGEIGVYLRGEGGPGPYRLKWRSPSFVHLQLLPLVGPRGLKVADLVAFIGSIDIVLGEVDR